MGCIKHSMMFEAQMTATFQYSMFPEEIKGTSKEKEEEQEGGEGTSLEFECGDTVILNLWNNYFTLFMSHSEVIYRYNCNTVSSL